jgi:Domain of unknown function (DUF6883)
MQLTRVAVTRKLAAYLHHDISREELAARANVAMMEAEPDITRVETSSYGQRYIVEGIICSPDTRNPLIRVVWFVESGEDIPRFVTAYPLRRDADD